MTGTNEMNETSIDLFEGKTPPELVLICETFKNAGWQIYLVGGAVRDILHFGSAASVNLDERDFDLATDASPEEVMALFARKRVFTIPTGLKHGTVTVVVNKRNFEVTTFRLDKGYSDGRRPDSVEFSRSLSEDLSRRDFTVNAMAYDVLDRRLIDPFGGWEDVKGRTIRTVGDPLERFGEDGLRPVRACRIASALGYEIEKSTFEAIPRTLDVVMKVSVERIHDELIKLMKTDKPSVGLEYLRKSGILERIMPEIIEGYGVEQNEYHKYEVYYHNLYACDAAPKNKPYVRLAALFHDLGKPRSKNFALRTGNGNVFYNHEVIGERMARKVLKRLKASNEEIERVCLLVKMHMFYYTEDWTDGAVRRFLRKLGGDMEILEDLFDLRRADRIGSGLRNGEAEILEKFRKRIRRVMEEDSALKVTDLDIDGHAIMQHFRIKPGRIVGRMLNEMLERVLDDPSLNTREELLRIGGEYLKQAEEGEPANEFRAKSTRAPEG